MRSEYTGGVIRPHNPMISRCSGRSSVRAARPSGISAWWRLPMVALLAVFLGGCASDDEPSRSDSHARSLSPMPTTSATSVVATPSTDAAGSRVAVGWLKALRGDRWDQPPTGWVDRVRPYVTTALAAKYEEIGSSHDTAARKRFVRRQCTTEVTKVTAVQPAEVPQRETTRWLRLTGTVRTTCGHGNAPDPELVEATVQVRRTAAGWRVSERLL